MSIGSGARVAVGQDVAATRDPERSKHHYEADEDEPTADSGEPRQRRAYHFWAPKRITLRGLSLDGERFAWGFFELDDDSRRVVGRVRLFQEGPIRGIERCISGRTKAGAESSRTPIVGRRGGSGSMFSTEKESSFLRTAEALIWLNIGSPLSRAS